MPQKGEPQMFGFFGHPFKTTLVSGQSTAKRDTTQVQNHGILKQNYHHAQPHGRLPFGSLQANIPERSFICGPLDPLPDQSTENPGFCPGNLHEGSSFAVKNLRVILQ